MFGFFKQWSENAAEYKALQNELKIILARQGVNFMHLHPEVTKCLVYVARDEGAEEAVSQMNNMMKQMESDYPNRSQSDHAEAWINICRQSNIKMAGSR